MAIAMQARRIAAERAEAAQASAFLASIAGSVNPRDLGRALWKDLHEKVADVRRGRGASSEQVDAALLSLDETLDGVNSTDVALRLLDEQVLARTGESIELLFGDEPRIAENLERTLGETYRKLGLHEPAELHAKRAAEIRENAAKSK